MRIRAMNLYKIHTKRVSRPLSFWTFTVSYRRFLLYIILDWHFCRVCVSECHV